MVSSASNLALFDKLLLLPKQPTSKKSKTICIVRLRERTKYTNNPLECIVDGVFTMIASFINSHPELAFTFYNCSLDGTTPKRNIEAVDKADYVVIVSDHEHHFHIPNYFHPNSTAKSNEHVGRLIPVLSGKTLILYSGDLGDSLDVFQNFTFPSLKCTWRWIQETDFTGGTGGLRYHFLRQLPNNQKAIASSERLYDFCYWGMSKEKSPGGLSSGDVRHKLLKDITKSQLKCYWIGRITGVKSNDKHRPIKELVPIMRNSRTTLCLNWTDPDGNIRNPQAITWRYDEAVATSMIPIVWRNFDQDGVVVKNTWLRVQSIDEFTDKVMSLRNPKTFNKICNSLQKNHEPMSIQGYCKRFEELLLNIIGG